MSDKETRIATAQREMEFPTLEQVKHVIGTMPKESEIERRNRGLIAFTLLTGARESAINHVDVAAGSVYHDAHEVELEIFTIGNLLRAKGVARILGEWG